MSHKILRRTFIALHLTLAIVIFLQSVSTVLHAAGGKPGHHNTVAAVLGSAEAIAALLFLLPLTMRFAGAALLLIFGFAMVFHGLQGEFNSTLLVYAAGVAFVMTHGHAFTKGTHSADAHAHQ